MYGAPYGANKSMYKKSGRSGSSNATDGLRLLWKTLNFLKEAAT